MIKTAADLKAAVEKTGSPFFSRKNMKFFGDTMRNYGVRKTVITARDGRTAEVYELYRRRPVKFGLNTSHYFSCDGFERMCSL